MTIPPSPLAPWTVVMMANPMRGMLPIPTLGVMVAEPGLGPPVTCGPSLLVRG